MEKVKEEFLEICKNTIKRSGNEKLLEWLLSTDFFTAPASSKYHLACEGGLCKHSLNVYHRLKDLLLNEYGGDCPYSDETIAIVSLMHDLCKCDYYTVGTKNQKTYDTSKVAAADRWQVKHDNSGFFIWETVQYYTIDEKFSFGHGEKSVYIVSKFINLTDEEAQAIRFHMSSWQEGESKNAGACFEKNPLAWFLHVADEAATFIDEKE